MAEVPEKRTIIYWLAAIVWIQGWKDVSVNDSEKTQVKDNKGLHILMFLLKMLIFRLFLTRLSFLPFPSAMLVRMESIPFDEYTKSINTFNGLMEFVY